MSSATHKKSSEGVKKRGNTNNYEDSRQESQALQDKNVTSKVDQNESPSSKSEKQSQVSLEKGEDLTTKISKILADQQQQPPIKMQTFRNRNLRKKVTKLKRSPTTGNKVKVVTPEKSISDSEKDQNPKQKVRGKRITIQKLFNEQNKSLEKQKQQKQKKDGSVKAQKKKRSISPPKDEQNSRISTRTRNKQTQLTLSGEVATSKNMRLQYSVQPKTSKNQKIQTPLINHLQVGQQKIDKFMHKKKPFQKFKRSYTESYKVQNSLIGEISRQDFQSRDETESNKETVAQKLTLLEQAIKPEEKDEKMQKQTPRIQKKYSFQTNPSPSLPLRDKKLTICRKVIVQSISFINHDGTPEMKQHPQRQKKSQKRLRYMIEQSDSQDDYDRARRHYKYINYNRPKRYRKTMVIEQSDDEDDRSSYRKVKRSKTKTVDRMQGGKRRSEDGSKQSVSKGQTNTVTNEEQQNTRRHQKRVGK